VPLPCDCEHNRAGPRKVAAEAAPARHWPSMSRTAVLAGYYGFGNTGDEAILASILAGLRQAVPSAKAIVLSGDPEKTRAEHGVEAVGWRNLPRSPTRSPAATGDSRQRRPLPDCWGLDTSTLLTPRHGGSPSGRARGACRAAQSRSRSLPSGSGRSRERRPALYAPSAASEPSRSATRDHATCSSRQSRRLEVTIAADALSRCSSRAVSREILIAEAWARSPSPASRCVVDGRRPGRVGTALVEA
jgi:hypothetical protein